jgi:GT2 family glycosyltransferase
MRNDRRADQPAPKGTEARHFAVSIIIVNWNSVEFVRRAINSIHLWVSSVEYEIIVVDGGSHDGCGQVMAAEFPGVLFVQSQDNIGFGRANNLGAEHARGRHLLLLNPDTQLRENSVLTLLRCLESLPRAGAVGCRLLNADGSLQTSCVQSFPTIFNQVMDAESLRRRFPLWRAWGTAALYSSDPKPAEVEAVSGACILVKREVFDRVGGFCPCYFMYGEDLDLCFKIKQAGYQVYHLPETSLVHFGGGCTDKSGGDFSNVMMRESVYRFLRRNRGIGTAIGYRAALGAASLLRLLLMVPFLLFSLNSIVRHGTGSLRKWSAILRWSLGLERRMVDHPGHSLIKPSKFPIALSSKS